MTTSQAGSPAWVTAERTGPRQYRGRNAAGAAVAMGPEATPESFTPGELLGIALAGCAGMSADVALSKRLGADVEVRVEVDRTKHASEDRYETLSERIVVDLAGLSEAERGELLQVVTRAIERACTVGNTVKAGAAIDLSLG